MEIITIDNHNKEIIVCENGILYDIQKDIISIEEAKQLIELIKQYPRDDIIAETVSSIKYHKTITEKRNDKTISTTYQISKIIPTNQQEINKFKEQTYELFVETYELYQKYTYPYIQKVPEKTYHWIYEYSDNKRECLMNTDDYFLIPDVKWDMKDMKLFYGICFSKDRSILSIRSLNQSHLPLLKKMKQEALQYIKETFGLEEKELIIYCHYLPSFYHFHIHFTSIYYPLLGRNNMLGKAILLDDIIKNITLINDYYQRCELIISVGSSHGLYPLFSSDKSSSQL